MKIRPHSFLWGYKPRRERKAFETINHPFYGCATEVIPKKASFCYNRVVQALLQLRKETFDGKYKSQFVTYKMVV